MKKIFSLVLIILSFQISNAQTVVDRTKPPKPGPAPVIKIKDPAIFKLNNGITVLVVENHTLPKVNAQLTIDRGPVYEGKKAGMLQMLGAMMNEGTKNMSKEEFDKKIDLMGADVSLSSTGGEVSALTRYFKPSFLIFADALENPLFSEESFEKVQSQMITGLKTQEKSATVIASRMLNALSYGKNTALGEFVTPESMQSLSLSDIKDAYKNYITPSRTYLILTGDITVAQAKQITTEALAKWTGKTLTFPTLPPSKNLTKTEINVIDVPSAVQAQLYVSNLIKNPMSNPDYFSLLLANQMLGGGAEGKLFLNLREKHGFTYGSYSTIGSGRFQSLVESHAQVRTEKTDSAVVEIIAEVKNMRDGKFTQAELDLAKAKYNGSFALGMEDPALAASYALNVLINKLPKDFYRTFLQKINAVTLADIKRVSQKYISGNDARIIIVGKAEQILPDLKRLNYPIKQYDAYGNPVEMTTVDVSDVKADPNIMAEKIIDNYLKAIGGKETLEKIKSYSANLSINMMGQTLDGVMKKMAPYSSLMEMTMKGQTVYKMVFDGTKGYQAQMGQSKPMSPEEIKSQMDEKGIFSQLYYTDAGYKISKDGTSKIDGEDTYKIKVTAPSGKISSEYYSIRTGFLIKQESTISANGQQVEQSVQFGNYKNVDGIMTPTSITQLAGGQEIPMTISDIKYNVGVAADDFK
ncbi:MAG: insulinase family protein [Ginsengibacter sp.]